MRPLAADGLFYTIIASAKAQKRIVPQVFALQSFLSLGISVSFVQFGPVPSRALALRANSRFSCRIAWQPFMAASAPTAEQHDHSEFLFFRGFRHRGPP